MYFLSVGFGRPTAMLAKTSRHIEAFSVSVGIWDTTAMLAETDGPFVMTNAMLAKTNGHFIARVAFGCPKAVLAKTDRQAERCQSFLITCVAIP